MMYDENLRDSSDEFNLRYYWQVNSLRLKSSVLSKLASKHIWGSIYFAGDGTYFLIMISFF